MYWHNQKLAQDRKEQCKLKSIIATKNTLVQLSIHWNLRKIGIK